MDLLYEWWTQFQSFRTEWGPVVDIFLVILAVVALNFVLKRFFRWLSKRVGETSSIWDDAFYYSLSSPIRAVVWIIGLSIAASIGSPPEDSIIARGLPYARVLGWMAVTIWFLWRLVNEVEKNVVRRAVRRGEPVDHTTTDAVAKLVRLSILIIAGLVTLQTLGFSISGVLAFGGVGGIAIGFAAKDVIANLLGGLTIYLNRPFSVGDWIRSPDRAIEGIVEAVGWRATTVRQFDKRPIYVPNAIFSTVVLENPSRMTHRRIFETIGLRYDDAAVVAPIVADIRQMLFDYEEIDSNELTMVYFNQFGDSSLDFFVYCHTVTREWARYQEVKQEALIRCHNIINEHGGQVAYPTSTIHMPAGLEVLRDQSTGSDTDDQAAMTSPGGGRETTDPRGSVEDDG